MRVKKTLSLDTSFLEKAEKLRELLRYPDDSSLVEQLIREEWERRHGPLKMGEHTAPVTQHPTAEHPVTYPKPSSKAGKKVA